MALTVDIQETNIGAALTGCYLRITKLEADKEWVRLYVEAHVNEAARRDGRAPVLATTHGVSAAAVSGELFPALYAALKALPEYAGAQDC